MEQTGYKEVWIGSTPPTGSRRQQRDRRIQVNDLWFDTAIQDFKRCTSVDPPTWEATSAASANSGTASVAANALSVTISISPTDADYRPFVAPTWNTVCYIPTATKLAGSFVVWFGTIPNSAQSLYWRVDR